MRLRGWSFVLLLVCGCVAAPAPAMTTKEHPELAGFIDHMVKTHRFKRPALRQLFAKVKIRPEIVAVMDRPGEARPWHEYRRRFITPEQIKNGAQYWQAHRSALERAYARCGVPPEIVVAIIGVETRYGRNTGDFPVVDALATLAFAYPRRAEFFQRELEEYLLLTREQKLNPLRPRGSYAGALGIPQFMPSSYRRYAVDFDNDRRRDLFKSSTDAIGSVAHFLSEHGWERDAPVLDEARVDDPAAPGLDTRELKPLTPVSDFVARGVYPQPFLFPATGEPGERLASLISLEEESGPVYRLGYANFYTITRYNRSKHYAAAVYELAQALRQAVDAEGDS